MSELNCKISWDLIHHVYLRDSFRILKTIKLTIDDVQINSKSPMKTNLASHIFTQNVIDDIKVNEKNLYIIQLLSTWNKY